MTIAITHHKTTWPHAASANAPTSASVMHVGVRVGVGAIVLDEAGRIGLLQRGPLARNEQGMWACPGGAVERGERLAEAIIREVQEEIDLEIAVLAQLAAFDHVLPDGEQWVSVAFVANHLTGTPTLREPGKSSAWGWFAPNDLPEPLSPLAQAHLTAFLVWSESFVGRATSPTATRRAEMHQSPRHGAGLTGRHWDTAMGTCTSHRLDGC
jgi:8-oxo-dGTP diphosphatase